jgi:hypothetical protein
MAAVLAQALCRDEVVQQAFPDGIAWITIGREAVQSDTAARLREIGKVLGDDLSRYDTEIAVQSCKPIVTFTCDGAVRCCTFAGDSGGHLHFLRLEQPKFQS